MIINSFSLLNGCDTLSIIFAQTFFMDSLSILFTVAIVIFLFGSFYYLYNEYKKRKKKNTMVNEYSTIQLQLQAYERLTLFVDRVALPNLISRVNQPSASVREMQVLLTQHAKQEFEHNITQQIYVSADAWTAVKNLKDQNILIVNQLANLLPPQATGIDLCKVILEFLMNDPKGTLPQVVSEVLSFEAKKLL